MNWILSSGYKKKCLVGTTSICLQHNLESCFREVEAFITANCVELAKDKWLCPLSGKKFKGPEFIRKHLTTKHGDKLEQVRQEVKSFAYIRGKVEIVKISKFFRYIK